MPGFVRAFLFLTVFTLSAARADEGMWLYNRLPKADLKAKYGFEPTDAWTERAMRASVRFNNGGSGSFISPDGLVMTNHHVASDVLYKLSTPQKNLLQGGFLARTPQEELKAPDLELNQLVAIEDVTARVEAAVKPGMSTADAAAARRAVIARIEKESFEKTGLRSDVVTLYKGGEYHLYRYKKYTDVRLVFAPETATAFFGGDPDNFEYPRYCLDMTLLRVYEDGKPAHTPDHFTWSKSGAADGELVFVSGHPGRTDRLFTMEALRFQRDVRLPYTLNYLRYKEGLLLNYAAQGDEQNRQARDELFGVQNARKAYLGRLKGLQDPALMAAKQRAEYRLRSQVDQQAALKSYGTAWTEVAEAQKAHRKLLVRHSLLERGQGFESQLFSIARHLVRMAEEDRKKDETRLPEYRSSNRESLEQELFSPAPLYDELETAKLAGALSYLVEHLGERDPLVRRVLQGQDPDTRAAALVSGTTLKDPAVRRFLAKGGKALLDKSLDPMILLARDVDRAARAVRKQFEEKVEEVESQAYAKIAKAVFATQGTSTYPDATFTLRLSYGVVKGYTENGKAIPPWTTMGGAFDHEAAHGAKDPWQLPRSWHDAKGALDLSTPFNFVSTNDIIGGNSGSPVFNRAGEIVGLIFDGNIQSLPANFAYSEVQARAVSVHSSAMREAMEKIYGAAHLVKEFAP